MTTPHSARSASRWRRVLLAAVVMTIGASTLPHFGTTAEATVAAPADAGAVVVVDGNDPSKELTQGGSATRFTLRLPSDATCPGDSANDQWRVQSFLVPVADDPGRLVYGLVTPEGDGRWSLVDGETHPYINVLTLQNSRAGQPGQIASIPAFSFVLFPPGTLPDGRYRVGIACTYFGDTAKYWDTELVLTTSPSDHPGQLTWRTVDAPDAPATADESGSSNGRWVLVGAGVLVAAAVTIVLWQRNSRRAQPLLKEHT